MSHQLAAVPENLCSCRTGQTGPAHCHSARPSIKAPVSAHTQLAPRTLASSCLEVCPGITGETSEPPSDLPPLIFLGITQLFWNPLERSR
ncbi:mCG148086 [Mus musculus]|nr:mCG148086 [Mus musculus]